MNPLQATQPLTAPDDAQRVDSWLLLTGGSVRLMAGFASDLLRLGVHEARRALAGLAARHHDHCPGGCS